jgi:hypothetical protein
MCLGAYSFVLHDARNQRYSMFIFVLYFRSINWGYFLDNKNKSRSSFDCIKKLLDSPQLLMLIVNQHCNVSLNL